MMKPERNTKRVEPLLIGVEIRDRPGRDAGLHRGLGDGRRDAQDQARIERIGDQRAGAEVAAPRRHRRGAATSEGASRASAAMASTAASFISSLIVGGADIERAAENVGKAQDVVDLVGIVRAPGADHRVGPRRRAPPPA